MSRGLAFTDIHRAVAKHRALLAGGLTAGAVAAGLTVVAPEPAVGQLVVRAAADLPAGTPLTADDLEATRLPPSGLPEGAVASLDTAVGRLLAAPVRRGEVLTDLRLAGAALLTGAVPGRVAVPVRLADAASVALLHAGDRIDVLAASSSGGPAARLVATGAQVLAVPTAVSDGGEGALVVLSETPDVAAKLAAAALSSRLSFTLRPAA